MEYHDNNQISLTTDSSLPKNGVYYIITLGVSIVTMSKKDRSKTDEVYVCGFVPCHELPNKRPNSLDPFLLPLIEEIEELFINGMCLYRVVEYACD